MKGALENQLGIQDNKWPSDDMDTDDSINTFMLQGKDNELPKLQGIKMFSDKSFDLLTKPKIHHGLAPKIKGIRSHVLQMHKRYHKYDSNLHGVDRRTPASMVDPSLFIQCTKAKELVGIDETRDELIKVLIDGNGVPLQQGKIVSVFGYGGLGKTTLAKAVYKKIRGLFDCCAFVMVSRTPDLKKLFKELLYDLGMDINEETFDESQLINILKEFLEPKRYFIVIDGIWLNSTWKDIKYALPDNGIGCIIITTRSYDVAQNAGDVYKLKPLSRNNS